MDYHLKPLGKVCAATGQPLAPGMLVHSVLVERQGELARLDYSPEGWTGEPPYSIGAWRTMVPLPSAAESQRLNLEQVQRYFEHLSAEASPSNEPYRYVMALLLLQKRRMRLDDARGEGEDEFLCLSGMHGEGTFEVRNLRLSSEDTQQLQDGLRQQLATEWT